MDLQENNYEDMKKIVLYQNKILLRKICRKFNWDYNHGLIFPPNVANDVGNDVKEYPNENLLIIGTSILGNEGKNFYTGMVSPTGDYITAPSYGLKDDDIGERCLIHPIKGEVFFGTTNFPQIS